MKPVSLVALLAVCGASLALSAPPLRAGGAPDAAAASTLAGRAVSPFAHQQAPQDGWASQQGGTRGGAGAARILTVRSAAELRRALAPGSAGARIVQVDGIIDMSEGRPYTSRADQALRGLVALPSDTTLIGLGERAGFINAHIMVRRVSQVIIRNLHLRNPCDVAPTWDPQDGAHGNWNAEFDAIAVVGASHVWVDHNSFTDAPGTDNLAAVENGKLRQCHDGALDIRDAADFITVSYNHFALHAKTMLVGASDQASADAGHLRITLHDNLFEHVASRAPRVRFGQVHLWNNYYLGERRHPQYRHDYSVGVAKGAQIVSQANAFDIAGARSCKDAIHEFDPGAPDAGILTDSASLLNGQPLGPCGQAPVAAWPVPYAFTPRPAAEVAAHVLATAGAGKLLLPARVAHCPGSDYRACDGFDQGLRGWDLVPGGAPSLRVQPDSTAPGNTVLRAETQGGSMLALARAGAFSVDGGRHAFLQARIRTDAGGPARALHLVGRYRDARNWVGAGIELAAAGDTMKIELVSIENGVLTRLKSVPRARLASARFASLRLEMTPSLLAVYLDGEKITSAPQAPFEASGARTGILLRGGSFDVDDLRAGVPQVQPARIAPALAQGAWFAQAGEPARLVALSALASDGATRLAYAARSSNPQVASVELVDQGLRITPLGVGQASVTVTGQDDAALTTTIAVQVGPAFQASATTLAQAGTLLPAPGARAVPVDTLLRLRLPPGARLGSGALRIVRVVDGALVDIVHTGEEVRAIGDPGLARRRYVRMAPITIDGDTLLVRPHAGVLAYGQTYALAFSDGLLAPNLPGIGLAAGWTFSTAAAAPTSTTLTVGGEGEADFRTVQGALDHAMRAYPRATPVTVSIRNGRYPELLFVLGKDNLTLRGESRDGVVIHATNNDGINPGSGSSQGPGAPGFTGGRALLMAEESDMLTLENLTLHNTTIRAHTRSGQAETVYFNSDGGRLVARQARFLSEQDTIQVKGYAWFWRSLIEGNVDFIWGANRAALFEESELRTVGDSANPASGGYLVQARTVLPDDPGFVFLNSVLSSGPGPTGQTVPAGASFLARSPGTAATWDNVSFLHCRIGPHVAPAGWAGAGVNREPAPNPRQASATRGWREFGSLDLDGRALDLSARRDGHVLSAEQAQALFGSRKAIFARFNGGAGWEPVP